MILPIIYRKIVVVFLCGYVEIDVHYEVLDFDYIVDMKLDNQL